MVPLARVITCDLIHHRTSGLMSCVRVRTVCSHHIGSAIAHCHHLGVAHRDIKLENVVLRGTCVMDGLLLIDFGLAEDIAFASSRHDVGTHTVIVRPPLQMVMFSVR